SFNNFDHNDIIGNRGTGVLVGGGLTVTANTFEDNNVRDNTARGFELFNPAPGSPGVTRQNSIRRGSISGHTFEGILLDFGANEGIGPPTIETVSTSEGLFVSGTAEPNAEVDIYVDPADEGLEWIGTAHTSLDGFWDQGTWSVPDVTAIIAAPRAGARVVHATQTDVDGNTSQFSSGAISGIAECLVPNPDGSTLVTL